MKLHLTLTALLASLALPASAGITLSASTTFGGPDGWLSPAENTFLDNSPADTTRGIAYNPATGHLLMLSRDGGLSIRILDGGTGAELGIMSVAGISGGTFVGNHIAVDDAGIIYACNLASPVTANFKIYRWAEEGEAPVNVFASTTLTGGRLGDSFNITGSGVNTRLVAGESNSTGTGTRNGFALFKTTDGINFTGEIVTFGTNPPAAGDFRLGITFLDADRVLGTASSSNFRLAAFNTTSSTWALADSSTAGAAERPMDYAVVGGVPLLATVDTNSSLVRLYNMTDANNPALVASLKNASGAPISNSAGLGAVSFGPDSGGVASLYALNTNNGIQAFTVTVTPDVVAPTFSAHPASREVYDRGQTTLTASANGTPPPTYQWLREGDPVPGATSATLTINPASPSSAGSYVCRATNSAGSADSNPATLSVVPSLNTAALTTCWSMAPGSRPWISAAGDTERGIDYNPANNHVYVISRASSAQVYVLDGTTGADVHQLDVTGVAGGNFALMSPGVNAEGAVYACNLSNLGDGSSFKIYKWTDDAATTVPVAIYDGNPIGTRIGDSFDVRGSGDSTQLVAGARNTNQFVVFSELTPGVLSAAPITVTGVTGGSFGLGVAFGEGNTVWGKGDGGSLYCCSFDITSGTGSLIASYTAGIPAGTNPLGVDIVNRCIAMIDTGNSDNVRLYSYSADAVPVLTLLDQEFFSTDNGNLNRVGSVFVGAGKVYALDTNNGVMCLSTLKPALPALGAITPGPAGNFSVEITGTAGFNYVIESSSDLVTWAPFATVPFTAGAHTVQLPTSAPRTLYRARLGP